MTGTDDSARTDREPHLSWPPWLENLSDAERIRAIVAAVARCGAEHGHGFAAEAPARHCTVSMAEHFLAKLLPGADQATVSRADLRNAFITDGRVSLADHREAVDRLSAAAGGAKPGNSGQVTITIRPVVVCLCGSTRFMDAFHEAGWNETLAGKIVLSVGVAKHVRTHDGGHAAEALGPGVAEALDELHRSKIDLADEVLVVSDESGYFGDSTRGEIEYAYAQGKRVRYVNEAAAIRAVKLGLTP